MRPALFLDRDGVINVDHAYVHRREDFQFIDGIFDLVRRARAASYRVFVVTNQAGIARGYYTEDDFHRLTAWMQGVFAAEGAPIELAMSRYDAVRPAAMARSAVQTRRWKSVPKNSTCS